MVIVKLKYYGGGLMADKYKYYKQNEYPGERVAERKRVEEREEIANKKADARVEEKGRIEGIKADARVAKRGRMDDDLMDLEIERSTARAQKVESKTNVVYTTGVIVIMGLFVVLLVVGTYSVLNTRNKNNEIDVLNSRIDQANYRNAQLSAENSRLNGYAYETTPKVLYLNPLLTVYPANNERYVSADEKITVMFSEDMDPSTINANTFTLVQSLTADFDNYPPKKISGTVTYNNRKATFTPRDGLYANQVYGDVFTAKISTGVKDVAGNSLKNDYVWSFSTLSFSFKELI